MTPSRIAFELSQARANRDREASTYLEQCAAGDAHLAAQSLRRLSELTTLVDELSGGRLV